MNKKGIVLGVMLILFLGTSLSAKTDTQEWIYKKTKKGVDLYNRKLPNSPFKEYKAVSILDYPIEVLLEVLIDVPNYPDWMPDCRNAQILKEFSRGLERGNYYIHLTFDSLWPARDRDLVIESLPKTDWGKGISVIRLRKLADYNYPLQKGIVRLDEFVSEFKLEYVGRSKTRVTFSTYVDPGGIVPAFIAAIQTARVPYGTLVGLDKMAAKQKYFDAAARDYF